MKYIMQVEDNKTTTNNTTKAYLHKLLMIQ